MSAVAYDNFSNAVWNKILSAVESNVTEKMAKAVGTGEITALTPEDLETQAVVETWTPDNRMVLSGMKLFPTQIATQIEHKFVRQKSYGADHGYGEVGQSSLPPETTPTFEPVTTYVKLAAALSSVYKLAQMEKTVNVQGQVGASAITRQSVLRTLLQRKNRGIYFADTTKRRGGVNGLVPKGIIQQIREGTDGTVGTASRFGSHIIDAAGQPLTRALIRQNAGNIILNYGFPRTGVSSPRVWADFEASLDAAERLAIPAGGRGIVLGQYVNGMQTNGGIVGFHTDLLFDPYNYQTRYRAVADDGAPGRPTVSITVNTSPTGANVSAWDAASAGTWDYYITELKDGRESLARIVPGIVVTASDEVALSITPSDPYSDAFRVHRILSGGTATSAHSIFEVANDNSGLAVTAYDLNDDRPGTHMAIFMDVASSYQDDTAQGLIGNLSTTGNAGEQMAKYFRQADSASNNVAIAHLGGAMFQSMELAPILMTDSRPLFFSAYTPEVRGPKRCFVVKNITPSSSV